MAKLHFVALGPEHTISTQEQASYTDVKVSAEGVVVFDAFFPVQRWRKSQR